MSLNSYSSISFTMYHNGSEIFNLPTSNLRQRIVNVFGSKTNEKLVPVNEETEVPEYYPTGKGKSLGGQAPGRQASSRFNPGKSCFIAKPKII